MKNESQIKPSWGFTVHNLGDIDISRILAEVPSERMWCIITDRKGKPVYVFIRLSLLEEFGEADRLSVANELLCANWGAKFVPSLAYTGSDLTQAPWSCSSSVPELPRGWRVSTTSFDCLMLPNVLETVLSELEAAEKFQRRIPVRVYVGGGYKNA